MLTDRQQGLMKFEIPFEIPFETLLGPTNAFVFRWNQWYTILIYYYDILFLIYYLIYFRTYLYLFEPKCPWSSIVWNTAFAHPVYLFRETAGQLNWTYSFIDLQLQSVYTVLVM